MPIAVCDAHRGYARIEEVLSIAGVELVESMLRDVELPDIQWDRSSVTFVLLP